MAKKQNSQESKERSPTSEEKKLFDAEQSHLDDSKHRHFSNQIEVLFDEVKELEERFTYTLKMTKDKYNKDLQAAQVKWAMQYQNSIKNKKAELEKEINLLSSSIDQEIDTFNSTEKSILNSIINIANEEESALIDDIMALLGFEF